MQTIEVNGIRSYCYHGCIPEERRAGGWFQSDVSIVGDFTQAMESDNLEDAVDYVRVTELTLEEMNKPSKLIEHVVGRILKALEKEFSHCELITVELTKFRAPIEKDAAAVKYKASVHPSR
jgi:dihydroneopterin aldolase